MIINRVAILDRKFCHFWQKKDQDWTAQGIERRKMGKMCTKKENKFDQKNWGYY